MKAQKKDAFPSDVEVWEYYIENLSEIEKICKPITYDKTKPNTEIFENAQGNLKTNGVKNAKKYKTASDELKLLQEEAAYMIEVIDANIEDYPWVKY